jgi:lysozyme
VATTLLLEQLQEIAIALNQYTWYRGCDPVRQSVLIDLAFNDGINGLLHFVHMIAAISRADWQNARAELLNSKAASENLSRYQSLAKLLLEGEG